MRKIAPLLSGVLAILLLTGCPIVTGCPPSSDAKGLTAFSFLSKANTTALSMDVTGTVSGTNITLTVPQRTDVTKLVASFTITGKSVAVGNTPQISGATMNDFSNPVIYTVTATDSTTQDYTVTVLYRKTAPKALTAFSFLRAQNSPALTEDVTGLINERMKRVTLTVPKGTDKTKLVASFTITGKSVAVGDTLQISGTTATDFTSARIWTVTATDGTTQNYTVWVKNPAAEENPDFSNPVNPGDSAILTLSDSSEDLTMIYANERIKIPFPTGVHDDGEETLTYQFWIGETEITNTVFAEVFQWAYDNDKFSTDVSDPNGLDVTTAKHGGQQLVDLDDRHCHVKYSGSGVFWADRKYKKYPVTNVTWYGAIMFNNWLTEMRDANTNNVVYSGIDDTNWEDTGTIEDKSKNGYRLPSSMEWEYAARYRGTDTTNVVAKTIKTDFTTMKLKWTKGNSASGATADYKNASATDKVAVYHDYWDGTKTGIIDKSKVKTKAPNALGIYDMSGNVWEWCFTLRGSGRVYRGGSWQSSASDLHVGYSTSDKAINERIHLGFRLSRTIN